jgi:hypothetical protein
MNQRLVYVGGQMAATAQLALDLPLPCFTGNASDGEGWAKSLAARESWATKIDVDVPVES